VIITTGEAQGPETGHTFQKRQFARQKPVGTEERKITGVAGKDDPAATIQFDRPLALAHRCEGLMRCEVANLSRNVIIESADPAGVRGHTMYHHGSTGSISYAEFRHLGKEGVLGKYPIHFHLVRDTMRGSGVTGASIWDSHNRWVTIHGTDHLLIRDCVGYQSRGHGYFLEDATEQWNVLDRNLAVQSFSNAPLPKQVLPYDPNDGAGFWWANGNNTLTRNVACENDHYGFQFHVTQTPGFDPRLRMRDASGQVTVRDVRKLPLLRFEDNEAHGDGLFGIRLGDETHRAVAGDRQHPFIARNLRVWQAHYAFRPNVACFLLEGLRVQKSAFGIYHPDYAEHVYRDIELTQISAEPLNGGHDEESIPLGNFTFDRLALIDCRLARDPLIQLTAIAPLAGIAGHFRGVSIRNSQSSAGTIDFGGGPRTNRTEHPVRYYFHGQPSLGAVTAIGSVKIPAIAQDAEYRGIAGWTGAESRGAVVKDITFPELLAPVDDLPPATLITHVLDKDNQWLVRGVSHDNGEVATVTVNGLPAMITGQQAGVAEWEVSLSRPVDGRLIAHAQDQVGNVEMLKHVRQGLLGDASGEAR
jgi:hypothetical protein